MFFLNSCVFFLINNIIYAPSIQAFHHHFNTQALHNQYKPTFTASLRSHENLSLILLQRSKNNKRFKYATELSFSKKSDEKDKKDDDDDDEDALPGIDEAFNALDEISNIDLDEDNNTDYNMRDRLERAVSESDDITSMNFIDEASIISSLEEQNKKEIPKEEEIKMYADMQIELEEKGEDGVYLDILNELSSDGGNVETKKKDDVDDLEKMINEISILDDVDGIGSEEETVDDDDEEVLNLKGDLLESFSQDFMDKAILEALTDTNLGDKEILGDSKSIFDEEEMRKSIDKVFEEANVKLKSAVEEVRAEQKESANKRAKERLERTTDEETRLEQAQGSVTRLLSKVNKESKEMEEAMKELQQVQEKIDQDPVLKVANFKNAGIVKQSLLALSILFSFRSLSDLVIIVMGNSAGGDFTSILVQFGLAIVFAFTFFFLK